jgi:DNA-directed RNA polymerase subunit RPC12/RpoP
MHIRCNRCSKEHTIPDDSAHNRKIYFFCTQCGHKIVVSGSGQTYPGTAGHVSIREVRTPPTLKNILDVIPRFFDSTVFFLSLVFFVFSTIILILSAVLFRNHFSFFIEYREIAVFTLFATVAIILYVYNTLLYIISKIQYYKNTHSFDENVDWRFIFFDYKEDALSILMVTIGFDCVAFMLLSPVFILGEYGFTYAAIIFPLLFIVILCITILLLMRNFIPAILALQSLTVSGSIKFIFRFIKRELVNLPFYGLAITVTSFFVSIIIVSLFSAALAISIAAIVSLSGSALNEAFPKIMASILSMKTGSSAGLLAVIPEHLTTGFIVLLVFLYIASISLLSILLNVRQSLIAQSCWIMQENKGHSVSKTGILITLGAFFFIAIMVFLLIAYRT